MYFVQFLLFGFDFHSFFHLVYRMPPSDCYYFSCPFQSHHPKILNPNVFIAIVDGTVEGRKNSNRNVLTTLASIIIKRQLILKHFFFFIR